jgi:hypothetical protein
MKCTMIKADVRISNPAKKKTNIKKKKTGTARKSEKPRKWWKSIN